MGRVWGWGRSCYRYAALRYIAYTRQVTSGKSVTSDVHQFCIFFAVFRRKQGKFSVHALNPVKGGEVWLHLCLISALDLGKSLISRTGRLPPV